MTLTIENASCTAEEQHWQDLHWLSRLSQEAFYSQLDQQAQSLDQTQRQALQLAAREHDRLRQSVESERQLLEVQIQAEQERREAEVLRTAQDAKALVIARRKEFERESAQKEEIIRDLSDVKAQAPQENLRQSFIPSVSGQGEPAINGLYKTANNGSAMAVHDQSKKPADHKTVIDQPNPINPLDHAASRKAIPSPRGTANHISQPVQPKPRAENVDPVSFGNGRSRGIEGRQQNASDRDRDVYLQIHQRLKQLRENITSETRNDKDLKQKLGDMRRQITKSVGQLTGGRGVNRKPLATIIGLLQEASTISKPVTNPNDFLAKPIQVTGDCQGSALLIYLLNIFSKAIISQFINEASVSPKAADPVGIIASHVFAHDDFRWHGVSMIDILIAKFHVVCPVLFGLHGSEETLEGRQKLGWQREDPEGPYISAQRHFERMTGLAAGYAALSLRNFEKTRLSNPFPASHYWSALAQMANLSPATISATHFVVLKSLIQHNEARFISFYGRAAVALLHLIIVEIPQRVESSVTSRSLEALRDLLLKSEHFDLSMPK